MSGVDEAEYARILGIVAAILQTTGPVRVPVSLLLKSSGAVTTVDEASHIVFSGRVSE